MFRNFRVMLAVLVVLVLAGGAYAFAAANDVVPSAAGYSDNTVSGYSVRNIVYDLNATTPTNLDKITFTVAPTTGSVVAALVEIQTSTGGAWITCGLTSGTAPSMNVSCTTTGIEVKDVTALNVVASSSLDPAP